ncbi:hypothetical protein C2E19_23865 [Pseudomonas sp. DTU12.3]|uniref:glycosyltransferase family 39 protein n=1 Tax=Pseudomonas sp. DTU12.3 TaxID=2073078 RepID=UPI00101083A2|nr:glycosyltransferase family 39 protein [Pseudomonas sp. DTU12.3]QAX86696.1 hypothetical protein C2E19_23865 [Pseudomonas sp. DTU12.3]
MKPWTTAATLNRSLAPEQVDRLALAAVLLIALFVRFYAIAVPAIWYDEAYSLVLAREAPARIWALTALDVHPPLYYLLLHYWMLLWGDSPFAVRALSALADVGTLLLSIKLMSLISTRRATWIAAVLLAFLPISVRYSQEARMYTLVGFWLMAATVVLVCWVRAPEQKRFSLIYVLLMVAAFYTHYFAGLCVLVHWLFWWQSRSSNTAVAIPWGQWTVANLAIVFWYLPWIPPLIEQLSITNNLQWIQPVTLQDGLALVWQFIVLGDSRRSLWQLMPFALMLLCAATIIMKPSGERRFSVLLVSYFFVPVIALYLISLVLPLFVPRYLVFSAPALAMMIAAALDTGGTRRAFLAMIALMLVVAAQLHGLTMVYRQTDGLNGTGARQDTGFASLVAQLNQNARPGDEIIIANAYWFLTFAYYSTTSIEPKYEIRSSMDEFLRLTSRGALSLINDPARSAYIDGVTALDCRSQRVWWVTDKSLSQARPLFAKDRAPSFVFNGGNVFAYLFSPDAVLAPGEASTSVASMPPPDHSAQNCPPAPFATSANRTRHSPRQ